MEAKDIKFVTTKDDNHDILKNVSKPIFKKVERQSQQEKEIS